MKRLVWLSDTHLNFVEADGQKAFYAEVQRQQPDAVLLTGDIAEAPDFAGHLQALARQTGVPILFVLGNHDFYRSSIEAVRAEARSLYQLDARLRYLPAFGVIQVTEETAVVGHDGWGDGRAGLGESTKVKLADFEYIDDLHGHAGAALFTRLRLLGDEAARHARAVLPTAMERFRQVIFLTHVPPLPESCWHQGRRADLEWQPHFVCQVLGEELLRQAERHPQCQLLVLCGHTHSPGIAHPLSNLAIRTAAARYGQPQVQDVLHLP